MLGFSVCWGFLFCCCCFDLFFLFTGAGCTSHCQNTVTVENAQGSTCGRDKIYIQSQNLAGDGFPVPGTVLIHMKKIASQTERRRQYPIPWAVIPPSPQMEQIQTFHLDHLCLFYFDFLPLQYVFTSIHSDFSIKNQAKSKILSFISLIFCLFLFVLFCFLILKRQNETLTILGLFVPHSFLKQLKPLPRLTLLDE